jgi:hypothetical protein
VQINKFKNVNSFSEAYIDVGDSLAFLFHNLENKVQKALNQKEWWQYEDNISKKWNINIALAVNTDKQTNTFSWNTIRKPSNKKESIQGSEQTAFGFSSSVQGSFFILPNCLLGIKMNFGIVYINSLSLGNPSTRTAKVDINRNTFSSYFFGRYLFRTYVGARPYADFGIGVRNYYDKETEFSTHRLTLDPGEKLYLKEKSETDPFINLEFGIEYLPAKESSFIYTLFLSTNFVFNNDARIYRIQFFAGGKVGLLL